MLLGLSKKKAEPILLFNIGSSSVSGALVVPDPAGAPKILFSVTEPVIPDAEFDTALFFKKTMRVLALAAKRLHASGSAVPRRAFCVLASPWYASATRHLCLRKNTPFLLTEKLADELIQKEVKLFSDEHLAQYAGTPDEARIIELKNVKTLLNGYEAQEPLYKKCRELDMSIFISMAGESVLSSIEKTIARYWSFERIKFSSFAVASFTVARDLGPEGENFLLVDVGGELSDIFMVKNNVLCEGMSFPIGRNYFVRGIAESAGVGVHEAVSLLSLYKDGHAAASVEKELGPVLKKLGNDWLGKFQESLAGISGDISVPSKVYVTSEGRSSDFFGELIRSEQFSQYTLAESKFDIVPLDLKILHELAAFEGDALPDPALIIDAVYISRFLATI